MQDNWDIEFTDEFERWWDKYGVSLAQIDAEVKEAEAVMHGFLKELGYE